ncbi:s-adenosyl-l-methionine-dependent methyltransferase [Lucifera butyrica]|uniref:S-adenosyl-l-methionine-dependent methyltransferase n=1 Tax=Lucifera butyrica TaxID=1351585 RepID=A0A498R535_9FIRM|nr:methyltransferase [Lucifera butyrica]VBB05937.1 s-adenosyl-l-methionine-dependent methyltransferase [Lucifera butyrica]
MNESATFLVDDTDAPALHNAVSHIARVGYCEAKVCERLGVSDITDLQWRALPIYREERLAVRDTVASAIDLFLLQGMIPMDELNRLCGKDDQEVLIRTGILSIDEKGLAQARASLFPIGNRLIFSDHAWPKLSHPGYSDVPYDQVMFIGTDSRWLARATVRRSVGSTLDLCTGSGVQALLAATHSQRVLAVDINPRAARCTRFNAHASGVTNVRVLVGDLYEPVGQERFDLITANPPFVPSPVDALQFRDGGCSGEEVQRRIIAGLPNHLAPGGIAQIVTELGEREDEPLSDRLREWLGGAPMDIHILRLREHSAASYAIGHANGDDTYDAFFSSVHAWANNLRTQGYSRVVSVLLAFQWSDPKLGLPWTRSEEAQPPNTDCGAEVETTFLAERMACKPDLYEILEYSKVRRTGPIGLMEARVLGNPLYANTQAKLLGKALSISQLLEPVERDVLTLIEKPLSLPELFVLSDGLNLNKKAVLAAVRSLLRRGLVLLT